MTWSFPIGRLFGSELRVHATFFLLLLWVGWVAFSDGGWPAALENILFVAALFACVVAHEFGHALTARRYGIRTPDITLLPIGGLARLESMPEKPGQEILVALAGPAVNVAIWAILVVVLGAETDLEKLAQIEHTTEGFLGRLALVNLFIAVFNLLPAFPMDGGRVFRATLSIFMDRVRATRVAATGGQVLAFALGLLGLTSGNPILLLIAFFVFIAAGAESNDVAMRDLSRRMMAREAMITTFDALSPDDTVSAAGAALIRTTQHEFPVLDADGQFVGLLTRNAIFAETAEGRTTRPVHEVMETEIPTVGLGEGLEGVFDAMYRQNAPAVAVTRRTGEFVGYITRENVGELMMLNGRRGS
ncbi:site-2 protease family protein [Rhodosalinus sp. K401]|uniref:site-2 protease family protein n=1 Tax=Rhodosalinus sp. K401 TaxID=3239195 RepID=UPI0035267FCF